MDPNTNQPQRPQPGQIANNQPFTPPRPQPDWQQGLGGVQPQAQPQYQPSMNQSMPQSQAPALQSVPQSSELPTPTPTAPGQQQPTSWSPLTPPTSPSTYSAMSPPTPSMGAGVPSSGGKGKRVLSIIGVILVLALLGAAVYWFAQRSSDDKPSDNTSTIGAVGLETIDRATLLAPDTIQGFTSRQTGIANIKDYVADDNSCELIVGTTTAAQLPGVDLNAIVQPQIEQLKKAGATVNGPSEGSALILKDMDSENKTYSLPTVKYDFSQDKKHVVVHYSAVILKSGDRVVVNRTCINQNGEVDNNKVTSLDTKVKAIQVMVDQK